MEDRLLIKDNYVFWTEDPTILYRDNRYLELFPISYMTRAEKLNSITRFCIYYIILSIMFNFNTKFLYIPLAIIIFVLVLHNIYYFDPKGKEKELFKEKKIDVTKFEKFDDNINSSSPIEYNLEAGYYDSNGKLNVGPEYTVKTRAGNNVDYTANEIMAYQKSSCRRPTKDNPFMNPPMTDFNNGFKPSACNADDEDVKEQMNETFNIDLYRNIEDLFNVKNYQRQFYTIPTTAIPNDQTAFAEWLYRAPTTCKEDSINCLRSEDLRFKR